ncbi:tyrosine-protein phosphatase non-receptor type 4-like isoform X2 [Bradysia coprophila]|uniref:tyrosine-protein phosphatase non-receptor type 4-like isoform X2 n=1 Tax=Bradysia coprophila TaxID=38358 RepID=UPI00187DD3E5|nr:tyrosine-protein phosphatase non-receptor type 4-like isoform X2 [Bradysia coprophila]XP_037034338.1 tyrosine-protein phosphatase non-receptor type 4-like isoform X2 [Bradysia coprophila]
MLEKLRIGRFSSSYKTRNAAELAREKKVPTIGVTVLFLDDSINTFTVEKRAKGGDLLGQVFDHLELFEKDYFGLQYIQQPGDVVRWLDPNKPLRKQWDSAKGDSNTPFLFRVKFYVTDPSRLQEEYTRYQFYLQIKRDIFQGKLTCPLNTACLLASYTVQSELGDYNPLEHLNGYLSPLRLLAEQTEEAERRISELHKLHRGQLPADAEYNYLEHAKKLYMYGVDLHKAVDSTGKEISLGVTSVGLVVFQNNVRMNVFSWSKMVKISFKRKEFFIQLRREPSESYDTLLGFGMGTHKNAKSLWKSCVEHHSFFRLERPNRLPRFLPLSLGSKFYYSGRTELQAVQESKQRGKISRIFTRSPSKRILTHCTSKQNGSDSNGKSTILSLTKSYRSHDNKIQSKQSDALPRKAWESQSDDDGGFIERCAKSFEFPLSHSCDSSAPCNDDHTTGVDDNLITVRLVADEAGRFGFNVRGGVDLNLPVLVSRVAPHTPADRTNPRISQGDQVVMINGCDVSGMLHEQVVSLIRSSTDQSGELVLTVRPCVTVNSVCDYTEEEPMYQYVPDAPEYPLTGDALFSQSLLLLSDGLASGALLSQYEQLYRKNSDLAITEAKKTENLAKNRYRDISPYDCTRVVLIKSESGDYINANYVNMEIPEGGVNRYIATQGPLSTTTTDFWRMVQQESSHLIVMLTTVMERGRPKCHQYWPLLGEELDMGNSFSVKCLSEEADETGSFVFRELVLCDKCSGENRLIQHMQYLAWPDHGVPSDPQLFLDFTEKVRAVRKKSLLEEIDLSLKHMRLMGSDRCGDSELPCGIGSEDGESPEELVLPPSTSIHQYMSAANPPVIIHCSAGIGRTGVLILMDTALALMDAREPVYPLDIVQGMRDQRACMVQNVSQYRFVCECICAAYVKIARSDAISKSEDS